MNAKGNPIIINKIGNSKTLNVPTSRLIIFISTKRKTGLTTTPKSLRFSFNEIINEILIEALSICTR